jgi:hypothetical protein
VWLWPGQLLRTTRSNYFKVKDPEAFKAWAKRRCLEVWNQTTEKGNDPTMFAIASDDPDGAGWPSYSYDEETDEEEEFNIEDELPTHLADKQVAVLMEAGAEKQRYINGYAIAVHANGKTVMVRLDNIYDLARKEFGDDIDMTACEW